MKTTKRVFAQFSFHDRTGIQKYLERMAEKGWMLDTITKFFWRFRRIEPRRIHFAVSYFAKTSSFEPEPPEALQRFRDFCEHTGWVFCAEAAQMQIFYNESKEPVPIETDAMLEIESIHAGAKRQIIPAYLLLTAVSIMNCGMRIHELVNYPIVFLRSNLNLFVMLSVLCLFLMCALELGSYFVWRRMAIQAAERDGSFIPTRGNRAFVLTLLYILLTAFALLIVSEWNGFIGKVFLIFMAIYALMLLLVQGITELMKRRKASARTNLTVTIIAIVILGFALFGILTHLGTRLTESDFFAENKEEEYVLAPDEEYSYRGRTYTLHHHELPLYAEEIFTSASGKNLYSNQRSHAESIILSHDECDAWVRADSTDNDLTNVMYEIVDAKLPLLTDYIFNYYLHKYEHKRYDGQFEYIKADSALWNADEAYELYSWYDLGDGYSECTYLVRWDNRIVVIEFEIPLTDEQIATAAEKLGK